jgi:hypothetical protein
MLIQSFNGKPQALLLDFVCACGLPLNENAQHTIKSTNHWPTVLYGTKKRSGRWNQIKH